MATSFGFRAVGSLTDYANAIRAHEWFASSLQADRYDAEERAALYIQSWFRDVVAKRNRMRYQTYAPQEEKRVVKIGPAQSDRKSHVPSAVSDFLGGESVSNTTVSACSGCELRSARHDLEAVDDSIDEHTGRVAMLGGAMLDTLSAPFAYFVDAVAGEAGENVYAGTSVPRIRVPSKMLNRMPKRIVIYYSETGGGHFASAKALRAGLQRVYGEQVNIEIIDFIRTVMTTTFSKIPEAYQILGNYPSVYKTLWEAGRDSDRWEETPAFRMMWYWNQGPVLAQLSELVESGIDLIVSVHPLVNHLVTKGLQIVYDDAKVAVRVATVVTDLGSAHLSWFDPMVDALFVPGESLRMLADRHLVDKSKIHVCGLPVREGFWTSTKARRDSGMQRVLLNFKPGHPMQTIVLLMGGGEGFGNIIHLAKAIGHRLQRPPVIHGHLVVLCGRNAQAKEELEKHEWPRRTKSCMTPTILGFMSNVDAYMDIAYILVTKAGPGSIAEAMIKGLPCLLTSFIPGQEEGNIEFVENAGAGKYVSEDNPEDVAETIAEWIENKRLLIEMSSNARRLGRPEATLDIATIIGEKLLNLTARGSIRETRDELLNGCHVP